MLPLIKTKWLEKKEKFNLQNITPSTLILGLIMVIIGISLANYLGSSGIYFSSLLRGESVSAPSIFHFHFSFWWLYLLIIGLLFVFYQYLKLLIKEQFGDLREGNKATNRFTTVDELYQTYKAIPYFPDESEMIDGNPSIPYAGKSGALIARHGDTAFIDTSDSHSIIVGRTRGGKDETKVLPDIEMITRSEEKPHLVISTVKYETLEKVKERIESRGYQVEVLNLIDMDYSFGYNCLELIKESYIKGDIDEAVELCLTFTHPLYYDAQAKDKIWQDTSMALVNACILAMCYEFLREELPEKRPDLITMGTLVNFLIEMSGTISDETGHVEKIKLDSYFSQLEATNPARQQYMAIAVTSGQMRSSIFGTALSKLQKFVAPKMQRMMTRNTFKFSSLSQSEQPYAVFILLPDFTQTNYILASTWIEQCYYYLSRYASEHHDRLPKRVRFILNEFGNMPVFTSLTSMISVGAGRGMLFDFYIQDFAQFQIKYGKDVAKFAESQLMNCIYIASSDTDTHERFSKMLGNREVIQKNRSGKSWSLNKSISEQVEIRPLMYPYELAGIFEGEWVVFRTKRLGNNFQDVKPYPIFNSGANKMSKAHQYLEGTFQRKSFTEINIHRHHNELLSTSDLRLFTITIKKRLNPPSKERNETLMKDLDKGHSQQYMIEEYPIPENIQGQILPETLSFDFDDLLSNELYQSIEKKMVYFPDLQEEFNQLDSMVAFQQFVKTYSSLLRIDITEEVDNE